MGNNELNNTWFGYGWNTPKIQFAWKEYAHSFWHQIYPRITAISVISWIVFFIIVYGISTYIKYKNICAKDKSITYKQVLKDSGLILSITIILSILIALFVYIIIDWHNPIPIVCELG